MPLANVTPSAMRRIAREVAVQGLAGEQAMETAQAQAESDKNDRLVMNYLLLLALVEQGNEAPPSQGSGGMPPAVAMQHRARLTVAKIAPRLGRSENWIASALEAIADAFMPVGIKYTCATSRMSRLFNLIQSCSKEIADWSQTQQSADQVSYIQMICAVADFTLVLAEAMLKQTRCLTDNVFELLRSWAVDPDPVITLAGRSEWLLDGWEQICFIWRFAKDDAARRVALIEMAQYIPILPREIRDWADQFVDADISLRLRRMIPLNEDWRTGSKVFELIIRNEHFRAATY